MSSTRDIKRRIRSVKSTQQITRAMKMVSAAKLRKTQSTLQAVRPFTRRLDLLLAHIGPSCRHLWLEGHAEEKPVLYLALGADRGLAGGFNGNLHRFLDETLAAETRPYALAAVGGKLREHCRRQGYQLAFEPDSLADEPDFAQARTLAQQLSHSFEQGEYGRIILLYSAFRSSLVHDPALRQFLPIPHEGSQEQLPDREEDSPFEDYIFEPSPEEVLLALLPLYAESFIYTALLEAKAAEHGARMTAMASATENADDMISRLTLSLNRARQAAITTEISEIVAGAAALV